MEKSFKDLCNLFESIEKTSSRLDMTSLMSDFLKQCTLHEIQVISYLVQGRISPMFVDKEFNYSEKSLINLIESYGKSNSLDIQFNSLRQRTGDIGDAIYEISDKVCKKVLSRSVSDIYNLLWEIANTNGTGSVEKKSNIIMKFLTTSSSIESKYFSRIVCGSLRLGLHSKTMMDVFSYIVTGEKILSEEFARVYGVSGDIGYVASLLDNFDISIVKENIENITVNPGFPVLSRLVERVGSFEEVIERLGNEILVQPKFDGLRLQIHKYKREDALKRKVVWQDHIKEDSKGLDLFGTTKLQDDIVVKLFTRNLEDVTDMFPEVVDEAKSINIDSFILDSEVLGWDYSKNTFLSYQETMQRKRKYNVHTMRESIPVRAMIFDLLFLNGQDLTQIDTVKRIEKMEELFEKKEGSIKVANTVKVSTVEGLKNLFDEYIAKGLEGLIVKQLTGGYRAGARNFEWIKLKKSMESGMVDTVDFVVVGYYYGSGRRSQLGIGALLGAIYNEGNNTYDAICKVGTGISDEMFKKIFEDVKPFEVSSIPKNVVVNDLLIPDVWLKPQIIITVDADEVTRDISKDKNGIGNGLSLRFPRLVEWNRDISLESITTVSDLSQIYESKKL